MFKMIVLLPAMMGHWTIYMYYKKIQYKDSFQYLEKHKILHVE